MQTSTPKIIDTARIEPRQYVAGIAANDPIYLTREAQKVAA